MLEVEGRCPASQSHAPHWVDVLSPGLTSLVFCTLGSALSGLMLTVFPLFLACNFLDRQHLVTTQDLCPCWLMLKVSSHLPLSLLPTILPSALFSNFSVSRHDVFLSLRVSFHFLPRSQFAEVKEQRSLRM